MNSKMQNPLYVTSLGLESLAVEPVRAPGSCFGTWMLFVIRYAIARPRHDEATTAARRRYKANFFTERISAGRDCENEA